MLSSAFPLGTSRGRRTGRWIFSCLAEISPSRPSGCRRYVAMVPSSWAAVTSKLLLEGIVVGRHVAAAQFFCRPANKKHDRRSDGERKNHPPSVPSASGGCVPRGAARIEQAPPADFSVKIADVGRARAQRRHKALWRGRKGGIPSTHVLVSQCVWPK
ncbi:MAG: hypothetical protein BJ554DRAFT_2489 [Olpidium bornovanus]|uniref:Uncharacterized protein n=1 Tax=Olpidium bornovanus TaxID=278681 RepID=A0A8H7ZQD8_9FUNG|nr:MAG: hypothetical protein BJ554DRAFT_2489 [Olpidium bornovanus]